MLIVKENSDILSVKRGFIMHQTNCLGAHGGLAGAIFRKWPKALDEYLNVIENSKYNPFALLGSWNVSLLEDDLYLIDFFGQVEPAREYRTTQYYAYIDSLPRLRSMIESGMRACDKDPNDFDLNIPYKLGCGLAGGDWDIMYKILNDTLGDASFNVVIHKLKESLLDRLNQPTKQN